MSALFRIRLVLDLAAACLLFVAYAYWWQGNLVHEIVGTGMFLLLVLHNVFNRRWYRTITSNEKRPAGWLDLSLTLALMTGMLALLFTSLMISQSLFGFLPTGGGTTTRTLHILAAWWVLLLVAVHLGLRWPIVMAATRRLFGISGTHRARTLLLRIAAVGLVGWGIAGARALGLASELSGEITLDMWDFNESVIGYFARLAAIAGAVTVLTFYASLMMGALAVRRSSARQDRASDLLS